MRIVALFLATILFITILLPAGLVVITKPPAKAPTPTQSFPELTEITAPKMLKVYDHQTKKTFEVELEDYLKNVLAGEMPASFELEALKAQAVVARTYTIRRIHDQTKRKDHPDADLCSDPAHCQAYASEGELKQTWGSQLSYLINWKRISDAVDATRDLIVTYQGQPIDAVYHSTCGGATENSWEAWPGQAKIPYLVSVPCEWDTRSPRYQETIGIPLASVAQRLSSVDQTISVAALTGGNILQITERTTTGRAKAVMVNGKSYRAVDLRSYLGINSTAFTARLNGDSLELTTVGYGHGVGLCQYGADGLARLGRKFDEILAYYYTGVAVEKIR